MGDSIQAAKAGILEIADVFVVNKADRPQVQETVRDLRNMIALAAQGPDDWKPPIVTTVATTGDGIGELVGQLDAHRVWLDRSGEGDRRRAARAREEVAALALGALRRKMARLPATAPWARWPSGSRRARSTLLGGGRAPRALTDSGLTVMRAQAPSFRGGKPGSRVNRAPLLVDVCRMMPGGAPLQDAAK